MTRAGQWCPACLKTSQKCCAHFETAPEKPVSRAEKGEPLSTPVPSTSGCVRGESRYHERGRARIGSGVTPHPLGRVGQGKAGDRATGQNVR